jgi:hypothetical protein
MTAFLNIHSAIGPWIVSPHDAPTCVSRTEQRDLHPKIRPQLACHWLKGADGHLVRLWRQEHVPASER